MIKNKESLDVAIGGVEGGGRIGVFAGGEDGTIEFGPGSIREGVPDGSDVTFVTE
ncbi:hypothetical protein JBE27_12785 [Streptomyces albiflaviniger]|nr:hypothetical protein [Streptomyces albiflaviniger]